MKEQINVPVGMCDAPILYVNGEIIERDAEGRYCLNDLQLAAVDFRGRRSSSVNCFMRGATAKALVEKLAANGKPRNITVNIVLGKSGGTYVCRELANEYAHQVGSEFSDIVARAFKTMERVAIKAKKLAAKEVQGKSVAKIQPSDETVVNHIDKEQNKMEQTLATKNGLIPVFSGEISRKKCNLCDARALHVYLNVGKDFTSWIKDRIKKYGFVEGEDFATAEILSSPNLVSSKARRQRMTDYHLTLDTAKELAMVENNEQGRMARRYFIECERKVREASVDNRQPQLDTSLPYEVEKACDFAAIRLSNDLQQQSMKLMGHALRTGDEELSLHFAFLVKRRLQESLSAFAKEQLNKNVPSDDVVEAVMSWRPSSQSRLVH